MDVVAEVQPGVDNVVVEEEDAAVVVGEPSLTSLPPQLLILMLNWKLMLTKSLSKPVVANYAEVI